VPGGGGLLSSLQRDSSLDRKRQRQFFYRHRVPIGSCCLCCILLLVLMLTQAIRSHPEKDTYNAIADFGDEMAKSISSYLSFSDPFNDVLDDLDYDVEDILNLEDGIAGDALINEVIDEKLLQYIDRENYPCWIPPKDVPTKASAAGVKSCAPSFIIAGAMKCGTTSMYQYLTQHPAVLHLTGDYLLPWDARKKVEKMILEESEARDGRTRQRKKRSGAHQRGEGPDERFFDEFRGSDRDGHKRPKPEPFDIVDRLVQRVETLPEKDRNAIMERLNSMERGWEARREKTDQSVQKKNNVRRKKRPPSKAWADSDHSDDTPAKEEKVIAKVRKDSPKKLEDSRKVYYSEKEDYPDKENYSEKLEYAEKLDDSEKKINSAEDQKSSDAIVDTAGDEETAANKFEEITLNSAEQASADFREIRKEEQKENKDRERRKRDGGRLKDFLGKTIKKQGKKKVKTPSDHLKPVSHVKSKNSGDNKVEKVDKRSPKREAADQSAVKRRRLGEYNESSFSTWGYCYDSVEGCNEVKEDGLCNAVGEKVYGLCRRTCGFCGEKSGRHWLSSLWNSSLARNHHDNIIVKNWGSCYDIYGDPVTFSAETITQLKHGERLCWSEMTEDFVLEQVPLLKQLFEAVDSRRRLAGVYQGGPYGYGSSHPEYKDFKRGRRNAAQKRYLRPIIGEKEVRFFDRQWYRKTEELAGSDAIAFGWYLDVFPIIPAPGQPASAWDISKGKITGEASPTYISGESATLVLEHLPEVKVILMLRNPVDRIYSQRHMLLEIQETIGRFNKQHGKESRAKPPMWDEKGSFDKAVYYSNAGPGWNSKTPEEHRDDKELMAQMRRMNRALTQGIYYSSVEPWTKIFPKEQLMFIRSEDFYEDEIRIMHRVEEFLGIKRLPDDLWKPIVDEVYNLQIDPKTKVFKPVARHKESGEQLHNDDDRMSKETRNLLKAYFAPHNERLEKLLSPWEFKVWR